MMLLICLLYQGNIYCLLLEIYSLQFAMLWPALNIRYTLRIVQSSHILLLYPILWQYKCESLSGKNLKNLSISLKHSSIRPKPTSAIVE